MESIKFEVIKKIVETKVYGAEIELIDIMRDELKNYKNISGEVIKIKDDIKEIKTLILDLNKKMDNLKQDVSVDITNSKSP